MKYQSTRTARRRALVVTICALLASSLLAACNFPLGNGVAVGSKGLWVANGPDVIEYIPSQMVKGTTAAPPHRVIGSAALGAPQGVAFDSAGNLWVLDPAGLINGAAKPMLLEFSATQLAALGTDAAPAPVAIITASALTSPQQAVFDAGGNIWLTDHDSNTVVVFEQEQLAERGPNFLEAALIISSADFNGPSGIAFDGAGGLWVSNNGNVPSNGGATSSAGTTIVGLDAANVPAVPIGGRAIPTVKADVTLSDDGSSSIQAPWALAFDTTGNLWSSNPGASKVVEFSKASLASTGSPSPAVIISSASVGGVASLNAPNGICFDDVGNLAAIDSAGSFGIAFFGEKQLSSGSVTPDTFIVGAGTALNAPAGCTYGPIAN